MRADNTKHLHLATRRRSDDARRRALAALAELQNAGAPITVTLLARHAHVARSWIYTQPDLIETIQRANGNRTTPPAAALTSASEASWQRRIELAHARISELADENRQLRHQLAIAHGQRRANTITSTSKTPSTTQMPSSTTSTTQ